MQLTDLAIHQIEFTLCAATHLHLGTQAGSQFRGALWKHLQNIACNDPAQQDNPMHSTHCPACYLLALEAKSPRGQNPPRPFITRPPLTARAEDDRTYVTGDSFTLGVNLIGQTSTLFPYLAQAIVQMGRGGVGYGRGQFGIEAITAIHPVTGERQSLLQDGRSQLPAIPLTYDDIRKVSHAWRGDAVGIRFMTPTQINHQGKLQHRPDFPRIIARLLERIEAIAYHYTPIGADLDWSDTYQTLVKQAESIQITLDNTRWVQVKGGSRRANRLQDLSGFVGEVYFAGDVRPFLPYLLWGQALHVGKNTPKGNGWYDIVATI